MFRSTIATTLRRLDDPERRRTAAGGLLLGSLGLLGGVWLVLPTPDPATPVAASEEPDGTTTSALLSGPERVVLPLPDEDGVHVETLLRHRRTNVEVLDATVVNTDQVTTELGTDDAGATRLVITSTAVHECDQYAGSVVVTSRHPNTRRDHLFIDLRFADCEGVTAIPAAPSSVNDTSRTWGDDGRAPWWRPPPPDPQPRSADSGSATSTTTSESTPSTESTSEPTDGSPPPPTPEPTATAEPTSKPTSGGGDSDGGDAGGSSGEGGSSDEGGNSDEGGGSASGDTASGSSADTGGSGSESPEG